MAVSLNPFAGRFIDDLRPLFEAGVELGERLMPELVKLLEGSAVSYGKDAIVGVDAEMEHGGACVHPMLGKPMRCAIGGGKAVISSNVKVAAVGASLDVPLAQKDDSWSFPHFDTTTRVGRRRAAAERDPCRHGDWADASKTDPGLSRSDDCSQQVGRDTGGQVAFALIGRQA